MHKYSIFKKKTVLYNFAQLYERSGTSYVGIQKGAGPAANLPPTISVDCAAKHSNLFETIFFMIHKRSVYKNSFMSNVAEPGT